MAGRKNEAKLLASCYRESLTIAAARQLASIAFPCISTGVYGYPPEQAADVAIAAVREFHPLAVFTARGDLLLLFGERSGALSIAP